MGWSSFHTNMYYLAAFVVIVALWSMPSVQSFECTDRDTVEMEVLKCFTKFALSVDKDAADVLNAIQNDICSNAEALKSGVPCFMRIARKCIIAAGGTLSLLPDINKVTDGINYLCYSADFDAECEERTHPAIMKCAEPMVTALFSVVREISVKFLICSILDILLDCARQKLAVCPRRTKEILVNSFIYFIPPACSGGSPEHEELRR